MKIGAIKINSSVVTFNLMSILVIAGLWIAEQVTNNPELINDLFGAQQAALITMAVNIITIVLRNVNVTGQKPIEIVRKDNTTDQ